MLAFSGDCTDFLLLSISRCQLLVIVKIETHRLHVDFSILTLWKHRSCTFNYSIKSTFAFCCFLSCRLNWRRRRGVYASIHLPISFFRLKSYALSSKPVCLKKTVNFNVTLFYTCQSIISHSFIHSGQTLPLWPRLISILLGDFRCVYI